MTAPASVSFGPWLKHRRQSLDLTQAALADLVGCSLEMISKLERGAARPSRQMAEALLAGVQAPPAERAALVAWARGAGAPRMAPAGAAPGPASPGRPRTPGNLPLQVTSFVGRAPELAQIERLLARTRLLTLVGAGGVGKTRVALEIATAMRETFPRGVWFATLAAVAEPALVLPTVTAALQIREDPGRGGLETLIVRLQGGPRLLVIDNCEHLVAAAADLADRLLRACPEVTILATSREPLHTSGEAIWRVLPLPVPEPASMTGLGPAAVAELTRNDSVRLFLDRVLAVDPTFPVTAEQTRAIAGVCRQLDGLPLAIELAAARAPALPVPEIAARLGDRFTLLTGGSRTALTRHQTLRACLEWSYDLLSDSERAVLRRLAVFAGGWHIAAAEAVCAADGLAAADVLDALLQLVDKSLVVVGEPGDVARYGMLDTIRLFAHERLAAVGERDATQARHTAWCLALAAAGAAGLAGGKTLRAWMPRLEAEHDNLHVALHWAGARAPAQALQIAVHLSAFWYRGGHWQEGRDWLAQAVEHAPTAPAGLRAAAWLAIAELAGSQGDQEAAQPALDRCLVLARASGDMAMISEALWMAGTWATYRGDLARATEALEESLAAARAGGGPRAMARALQQLGNLAVSRGDPGEATALYGESLALGQGAGDYATAPVALYCLAGLALLREEYQVAQGYCEQGMALLEAVGNTHGLNHPQEMLGRALLGQGDTAGARAAFVACLASTRRLHAFSCLPHTLEAFARLALAVATPTVAARLLGAVSAVGQGPRPGLMPVEQALYERTLARAQADLGADRFAAAFAAGGTLPPEEAMDFCRALA